MFNKPIAIIMLNEEKMKTFPLRKTSWNKKIQILPEQLHIED
jgi:hypothetical protein